MYCTICRKTNTAGKIFFKNHFTSLPLFLHSKNMTNNMSKLISFFLQIVLKLPSNIFTTQSQKLQWITFSRLFLYFKDFSMSFFVRQRWVDNRLNYTPTLNMSRLELDTKRMSNVWVPDLYFVNEKKADVHHVTVPNKLMHIYPDGLVVYSMR